MSKEKRRDVWWIGLMLFAGSVFGLGTYGYMSGNWFQDDDLYTMNPDKLLKQTEVSVSTNGR